MTIVVDRFEGAWVVLQWEGGTFNVPRALVPKDLREGDVLSIVFSVDQAATAERRERVRKLEEKLFKDG